MVFGMVVFILALWMLLLIAVVLFLLVSIGMIVILGVGVYAWMLRGHKTISVARPSELVRDEERVK